MKTRLGGMRHEVHQGSNRRNRRRGRCRPRLSGCRPRGLTLTRDETGLYVASGLSGDLSIVDMKSRKVMKSVPIGLIRYGILIDD